MGEKRGNEEKKTVIVGITCIVLAAVFGAIFLLNTFHKKKNDDEFLKEETEQSSEDVFSYAEFLGLETEREDENVMETKDDWAGYITDDTPVKYESFVVNGLSKEQVQAVDGDIEGLKDCIQETLYFNGYYDYREATSTGTVEWDDARTMITFNFDVKANEDVNVDATYYTQEKIWRVNVW